MHNKHLITAVLFAAVALPTVSLAAASKTTICHVPPGNPANAHAITISDSALGAHIGKHEGDRILAAGATCGSSLPVTSTNPTISAAVEICANSGTAKGRRIDVTGLGGVQTKGATDSCSS